MQGLVYIIADMLHPKQTKCMTSKLKKLFLAMEDYNILLQFYWIICCFISAIYFFQI